MLRETSSNNTGQLLRQGHSNSLNKLYEEIDSAEVSYDDSFHASNEYVKTKN